MDIDHAPFCYYLYLSKCECDFMGKSITEVKMSWIFRFIDDLCALKDGGQSQKSFREIYSKEQVLSL